MPPMLSAAERDRFARLNNKLLRLTRAIEAPDVLDLLDDAELDDLTAGADVLLADLAELEYRGETRAEDAVAQQTRKSLPAGGITRKSMTPDPEPDEPRVSYRRGRDGGWFEYCDRNGCRRVTDRWTLRWLAGDLHGQLHAE